MRTDPEYVRDLEHRVDAYSTVLRDLERARGVEAEVALDKLRVRAHNVLCHLEDGCGH